MLNTVMLKETYPTEFDETICSLKAYQTITTTKKFYVLCKVEFTTWLK